MSSSFDALLDEVALAELVASLRLLEPLLVDPPLLVLALVLLPRPLVLLVEPFVGLFVVVGALEVPVRLEPALLLVSPDVVPAGGFCRLLLEQAKVRGNARTGKVTRSQVFMTNRQKRLRPRPSQAEGRAPRSLGTRTAHSRRYQTGLCATGFNSGYL